MTGDNRNKPRVVLYDHAYETFAVQYLSATLKKQGFDTQIYYTFICVNMT